MPDVFFRMHLKRKKRKIVSCLALKSQACSLSNDDVHRPDLQALRTIELNLGDFLLVIPVRDNEVMSFEGT